MKILVIQDRLRGGGTERQSILLARAFAAAGHPTTLLTFRPGGALAADLPGVTHQSLTARDLHLDWFAPGLSRKVAALAPDVVLCMGRMANCHAGFLQRHFSGTAVVATMRTGRSLPFLFRRSLRLARHIVANSHGARRTLVETHRLPPDRITVIHNSLLFPGIDAGPRNETLRAAHQAGPATVVLLCVAVFRPGKNQRDLIDVAAGLPPSLDWQLWLAGAGECARDCRHLARSRGVESRVKFLGWQTDPGPLYRAADIAVLASHTESLSNFIIEAQAHGLPAVAYDAQGIDECLLSGQTGFIVPPGDRAEFRSALIRLAGVPSTERDARAARARAFAAATFDPGQQVGAYLELFRQLVGRQG